MTFYDLRPNELPPDAVLRIRNPDRLGWIAPRFSEPAKRQEPVVIAGEYWKVTRVDVEGDELVIGLLHAS